MHPLHFVPILFFNLLSWNQSNTALDMRKDVFDWGSVTSVLGIPKLCPRRKDNAIEIPHPRFRSQPSIFWKHRLFPYLYVFFVYIFFFRQFSLHKLSLKKGSSCMHTNPCFFLWFFELSVVSKVSMLFFKSELLYNDVFFIGGGVGFARTQLPTDPFRRSTCTVSLTAPARWMISSLHIPPAAMPGGSTSGNRTMVGTL